MRTRKPVSAVAMGTSSPNSRARLCLVRVFPATTCTGATDCLSARGTCKGAPHRQSRCSGHRITQ